MPAFVTRVAALAVGFDQQIVDGDAAPRRLFALGLVVLVAVARLRILPALATPRTATRSAPAWTATGLA